MKNKHKNHVNYTQHGLIILFKRVGVKQELHWCQLNVKAL